MAQLGKRYMCETCGSEVLCNKPGDGTLNCCDSDMPLKEAKPLRGKNPALHRPRLGGDLRHPPPAHRGEDA